MLTAPHIQLSSLSHTDFSDSLKHTHASPVAFISCLCIEKLLYMDLFVSCWLNFKRTQKGPKLGM